MSLMRIMRLNRPEVGYIALGSFAALITGSIQPLFGFIFASVISVSIYLFIAFVYIVIIQYYRLTGS